jgi:hypothetical protein
MALAPIGPIAVMAPVWGFIENRVPQVFRHQYCQRLPNQLRWFVTEGCFGRAIGKQDLASVVDTHHGVARSFDNHTMEFFPGANLRL